MKDDRYHVVFKSKKTGVCTWTSFDSKEYLEEWKLDMIKKWGDYGEIIEEGITEDRCRELVNTSQNNVASLMAMFNFTVGGR